MSQPRLTFFNLSSSLPSLSHSMSNVVHVLSTKNLASKKTLLIFKCTILVFYKYIPIIDNLYYNYKPTCPSLYMPSLFRFLIITICENPWGFYESSCIL